MGRRRWTAPHMPEVRGQARRLRLGDEDLVSPVANAGAFGDRYLGVGGEGEAEAGSEADAEL